MWSTDFKNLNLNFDSSETSAVSIIVPKLARYGEKFDVLIISDIETNESHLQLIFENEDWAQIEDEEYYDLSKFKEKKIDVSTGKNEYIIMKSFIKKFNISHELKIKTAVEKLDNVFAFILTDKDFYMPGEQFHFNVFFLNELKQSYHYGSFRVEVKDSEGNEIFSKMEETSLSTDNFGKDVYQYELKLNESLGTLRISIFAELENGGLILLKSKPVYVDDGVIRNVEIITNSSLSGKTFNLEITAKYTNGFLTKGKLKVPKIKLKNHSSGQETTITTFETKNFDIFDKPIVLLFDLREVFNISIENDEIHFIHFDMIFEDNFTKEKVIFEHDSVICDSCVMIEILEISRFMPGLPISFDINVKFLNSRTIPLEAKAKVEMYAVFKDDCSDDPDKPVKMNQTVETVLLSGRGNIIFETSSCAEKLIFYVDTLDTTKIFELKTDKTEYLQLSTDSR